MDEDNIPDSFFLSLSLSLFPIRSRLWSLFCCSLSFGVAPSPLVLPCYWHQWTCCQCWQKCCWFLYVRRLGCAVFRAIGFIVDGLHQRASLSFFFLFFYVVSRRCDNCNNNHCRVISPIVDDFLGCWYYSSTVQKKNYVRGQQYHHASVYCFYDITPLLHQILIHHHHSFRPNLSSKSSSKSSSGLSRPGRSPRRPVICGSVSPRCRSSSRRWRIAFRFASWSGRPDTCARPTRGRPFTKGRGGPWRKPPKRKAQRAG